MVRKMKINLNTLTSEEKVSLALRDVYEKYGYKRFKMSKFEEYSLYLENKNFLLSDNIITFNDLDGKLLALKPDVTLSIAKNAKSEGSAEKVYYIENVYRLDKDASKYREISQMGLEAIGSYDPYITTEVVLLALKSLKEIDENFVLDISNISFVTGLIDAISVTDYSLRKKLLDCIVSKNVHDLARLADEADLKENIKKSLKKLITINGSFKSALEDAYEIAINDEMKNALDELSAIYSCIGDTEFKDNIRLDFSIINDTNFYSGIVFCGYVAGVPRAVLSGGRYDKLLDKLGKNRNAIGFAVYLNEINSYYYEPTKFDVDCVVIYKECLNDINKTMSVNMTNLYKAIDSLIEKGYTVRVEKNIPKDLSYKTCFVLQGDGRLEELKNV